MGQHSRDPCQRAFYLRFSIEMADDSTLLNFPGVICVGQSYLHFQISERLEMQETTEVKKIGAVYTIAILLAGAVTSCAAQAVPTKQPASPSVDRDLTGCIDCSVAIPTLPQWCAIVMGLVLIGLSIFLMRRSEASTIAQLPPHTQR
jgi:hypothetical protein